MSYVLSSSSFLFYHFYAALLFLLSVISCLLLA